MFKNWQAICDTPDVRLMHFLSFLDLDSYLGKRIVEQLPEYFTDEEQAGPVPLTVLRATAEQNAARAGGEPSNDHLVIYDAFEGLAIPIIVYATGHGLAELHEVAIPVPDELQDAKVIGQVYEHDGRKLVLVDRSGRDDNEWYFVPAECIDVEK